MVHRLASNSMEARHLVNTVSNQEFMASKAATAALHNNSNREAMAALHRATQDRDGEVHLLSSNTEARHNREVTEVLHRRDTRQDRLRRRASGIDLQMRSVCPEAFLACTIDTAYSAHNSIPRIS